MPQGKEICIAGASVAGVGIAGYGAYAAASIICPPLGIISGICIGLGSTLSAYGGVKVLFE
jgi:hypothetical protein